MTTPFHPKAYAAAGPAGRPALQSWHRLGVAAALGLAALQAPAAPPASAPPEASGALDCMIQPYQVVQIGSPVAGVIEQVGVERGERVTRGQVVAQLAAGVERAAVAVARERAQQEGEVTATNSSANLAKREFARARELYDQNFVSRTYLDKQRAEAEVAVGRSDQAVERQSLAQRELSLAAAQLAQRTIRTPIDGVVVERFMSPGEFVDQKPILRIAALDPLRVDVLVPAVYFGRIAPGAKGVVMPELLSRSRHEASVKSVDGVIDAATNTFRVRLELPNRDNALPAGLRCRVDLGLPAVGGPGASVAAPAAPTLGGAAVAAATAAPISATVARR